METEDILAVKFYYILGQSVGAQSHCNRLKREASKLQLSAKTIDGSRLFHLPLW